MSCNTAWKRTLTSLATLAVAGAAVLTTTGCGPSPAYDQREPRVPVSYMQQEGEPEPLTADELAAQNAARGPQQQQQGEQAPAPGPNDIAVGADGADTYADTDPSALTEFRPALEGHGQWVDDATYGTIWVPAESEVGADFTPYTTAGHWTYDDAQNYVWVSDYSWGWAPFHYGRWVHVHHGWGWIPGRTYAGAWVVWRDGDPDYGYVGWAPMGPDWYWYNGYAVGWTFGYTPYYSYCHRDYFWGGPGYYGHVIRGGDPRYHDVEAHTHPYNAGPGRGGNGEPGNRTAANPSVGGPGRVAASPRVGPSPARLGMKPDSIVAPPRENPGLQRAQQLAAPRTAVAQGAAAPAQTRRRPDDRSLAAQAAEPRGGDRGISSGNSPRLDPVARAPQYNAPGGVGPRPGGNGTSAMNAGPRAYSSPSGATPMSGSPSPSYRAAPSYSAPQNAPQMARPSQAPNVAASRPVERSAPAFRSAPSSPSPTFRSAPSQTVHSAPSVSRPSAPSRPSSAPASVSRPASRSSSSSSKKR